MENVAISVTVPGATARKGHLADFDFAKFMNRVVSAVKATGLVSRAIIGLDVSFNDYSQRHLFNRWQFQAYIIAVTTDATKLKKALKKTWAKTSTVKIPVRVREFDGSAYAASYLCKFEFVRRVSYFDERKNRWNTKKRRLQANEHCELMLVLNRVGLTSRVAMIGIANSH